MTDHEKTQASLQFMAASKRAMDDADSLDAHRQRLVRDLVDANIDRALLLRLLFARMGVQALSTEALELAAAVVEALKPKGSAEF